jgi:hypothetical protein
MLCCCVQPVPKRANLYTVHDGNILLYFRYRIDLSEIIFLNFPSEIFKMLYTWIKTNF